MSADDSVEELLSVYLAAARRGQSPPTPEELCRGRPDLLAELLRRIAASRAMDGLIAPETRSIPSPASPPERFPADAPTATHEEAAPQVAGDATKSFTPGPVAAFEAAWRLGSPPEIAAFLPPGGENRVELALALARVDMEWRARVGQVVSVGDYLAAVPELAADSAACDALRRCAQTVSTQPFQRPHASPHLHLIPGYEILGELGRGAMGVVYKARQVRLNRVVALKTVLHGESARTHQLIRFLSEAEAVAAINHPNVVRVYEFGEHSGCPYLAMEYLEGGTLSRKLQSGGPLPPQAAAELVLKMARGVQAAHELNIVHRDLKPGNILLDQTGEPKVTDFGLAKRGSSGDLTATGALLGTPPYMAPEQLAERRVYVGPQADVWALGVMLYECLAGRRPFEGSRDGKLVGLFRQIQEESPPAISTSGTKSGSGGVPRDLRLIYSKCLEKNPAHRYLTARELADDLQRFLANEPISARQPGPVERVTKWVRRKPTQAALAGTVAALLLTVLAAGVTLGVWRVRTAERNSAQQTAHVQRLEVEEAKTRAALRSSLEMSLRVVLNDLAETGDAARGVVGLAHVVAATAEKDAGDLERVARQNLALWKHRVHPLQWVYPNGDRGPVEAAAFSPDGSRIAAAYRNGSLVLWTPSGEQVGRPMRPTGTVFGMDFSPDGTVLATFGRDGAELWDVAKGERRASVPHEGGVWAVAFAPDGSFLASAGEDRLVRVTNTLTGQGRYGPLPHGGPVHAVAVTADGKRILTGCWDRTARFWDATTGAVVGMPWRHTARVQSVAIAPDGQTAATGDWEGLVQLWRPEQGVATGAPIVHPPNPVWGVAFSPDGRTLLSWTRLSEDAKTRDTSAYLWDLTAGRHVATLSQGRPIQVARWTPDGRVIVGEVDGIARLWDAAGVAVGAPLYHRGAVAWVAAGPKGGTLMTADTTLRLWRVAGDIPSDILSHG